MYMEYRIHRNDRLPVTPRSILTGFCAGHLSINQSINHAAGNAPYK